jgi:phosphoribosylformylglycinamidine synthase subunit PurQ / glutaminase
MIGLMATPRVCVLRAPGTNCDFETAFAFESCGGLPERLHLFRLIENPRLLDDFQILCVPGGFSYGDDLGAGVIFSRQLQGRLGDAMGRFLRSDKLVLGICNGFQVLLKAGMIPGGAAAWPPDPCKPPPATITWNDNGRYTALWVKLGVQSPTNVFLRGIESIELPIAHAEGRVAVRCPGVIDSWRQHGQIALCYQINPCYRTEEKNDAADAQTGADARLAFPNNPNGSVANIAGLGDASGRILGLMPHPERFIYATQHPQWTRRRLKGPGEGLRIFRNAVSYFG